MQILIVDHDAKRRAHWADRLRSHEVSVTAVATCAEGRAASKTRHFVAAILGSNTSEEWAEEVDKLTMELRGKGRWVVSLVQRLDAAVIQAAYRAGFDDCYPCDASDAELKVKLEHLIQRENLNQRLAQAQKLESIGELAAGIAHEINTPIQYVGDNTRFVQSAYEDLSDVLEQCQAVLKAVDAGEDISGSTDKLREAIDSADVEYLQDEMPSAISQTLDGIDRVTNIVRAMKEFAHPGASEMTSTDLSKSIENTIMVARNEWKYVADMKTEFDPDLPPVTCLPGELNQVLLNMIVNAAHAIGEGLGESPEEKGTITIATKLATPLAEIRISDSGNGISQQNLDRIFAPFFTTKVAGKGTGQGLAIAHSVVVEKHGGTINVESTVGKGTTFIIRLPLEPIVNSHVTEPETLALATD